MNKVIISLFFKKPIDHGMKNAQSNTHHLKNTKSELSAVHKKGFCRQRLRANVEIFQASADGANPMRCATA
jgi:hypothetical protein